MKLFFFLASAISLFSTRVSSIAISPHALSKRSGMETIMHGLEEVEIASSLDEELETFLRWAKNSRLSDEDGANDIVAIPQTRAAQNAARKAVRKAAKKHARSTANADQQLDQSEYDAIAKQFAIDLEKEEDLFPADTPSRMRKKVSKGRSETGGKKEKSIVVEQIPTENIGRKMLEKMGLPDGKGLGREGQGMVEPIAVAPRLPTDKRGVGFIGPLPVKMRKKGNRFAHIQELQKKLDLSIPLSQRFVSSGFVGGPTNEEEGALKIQQDLKSEDASSSPKIDNLQGGLQSLSF